jgi:hypothetical protein
MPTPTRAKPRKHTAVEQEGAELASWSLGSAGGDLAPGGEAARRTGEGAVCLHVWCAWEKGGRRPLTRKGGKPRSGSGSGVGGPRRARVFRVRCVFVCACAFQEGGSAPWRQDPYKHAARGTANKNQSRRETRE